MCCTYMPGLPVKGAGWEKGSDDKWHKKAVYAQFSLAISRASYDKATNRMNWRAVASDTDTDFFGDNMTLSLFNDFVDKIQKAELPPEKYRSEFWQGGLPYMSISHYDDMNGKAVPGSVENVYIDGNRLKATGYFSDTPLGRACFKSVCNDLYGDEPHPEGKVRISIAFLDYQHKHKSNGFIFTRGNPEEPICPECLMDLFKESTEGKEFLKGQLVHLALTRVPANSRTEIATEVDKSMAIKTRKDDALSIIGDDEEARSEIEQIAEAAEMIGKSELVIKSEAEDDEIEEEIVEESQASMDEEDQEPAEDDDAEENESLVEEATTKKVNGENYPASDFLVVEDSSKPSTWHLQVKRHGKPDHNLMAAARAALTSNYRGNPYSGPNKSGALKKLKALYKSEGMDWEKKSMADEVEVQEENPVLTELAEIKSIVSKLIVEPAPAHPLDGVLAEFRSAYDEAIAVDGGADDKLRALQPSFAKAVESIQEQVRSLTETPEAEVEAKSAVSVDEVVGVVMQKIGPELAEIKSLLQAKPQEVVEQQVPQQRPLFQRRSLLPTANVPQSTLQNGQPEVKSSLRKLVERTTQ